MTKIIKIYIMLVHNMVVNLIFSNSAVENMIASGFWQGMGRGSLSIFIKRFKTYTIPIN